MSLGKGSKDDKPKELWNLTIFAPGEVESFLQLLYIDAETICVSKKYTVTLFVKIIAWY